jgi:glycerol-3-phosphate acyltransferase PlsY
MTQATMMPLLLRCLVCFAAGSVPFSVLAMAGSGIDIRQVGSGNPGFNNVLRVSKRRAVVALVGDLGKGILALWLVRDRFPVPWPPFGDAVALGWIFAFAAILGHCYSPFLHFRGGKGIATSGGAMLVLHPLWAVVALIYFAAARITLGKLRWPEAGALASLSTWVLFTLFMAGFVGREDALFAALLTVFLAWRHKKNVQNLLRAWQGGVVGS